MTDTLELSERQRRILEVVRTSVTERGFPPSLVEIGRAVGITSTSSVVHQLRALERKGFLRRDPGSPRAITLTDTSVCPTCGRGGKEDERVRDA